MGQDRMGRGYYPPPWGLSWDGRMPAAEENHYPSQQTSERKGAPYPLSHVLREHAHIPARQYFVAALGDDGTVTTFSSPNAISQDDSAVFFNGDNFKRCFTASAASAVSTPSHDEQSIPFRRHTHDMSAFDDYGSSKPMRKRLRASESHADANFGDEEASPVFTKKRAIKVGDEDQLWDFYEQRFKNCQQSACKLIAKAWIKVVEPKKQSTHPYTGKDEKAPDWWPQLGKGRLGQGEKVRHKEPDHLYKKERVYLLCHILDMVVRSVENQHSDIQRHNLNVKKLEEAAFEALSPWFADNNNPGNRQKKPYLKEIFKVAYQQEKFLHGEIDPTTKIHVMSDERVSDGYGSDNEDSSPPKTDDEPERKQASRSISPPKEVPQAMVAYSNPHGPMENANSHISSTAYVGDMSLRGAQYGQHVMSSELHADAGAYNDVANLSVAAPLHSSGAMPLPDIYSAHDPSRRPSGNAHSDFNTPTTPSVYSQWAAAATSAPNHPSMYSVTGQQASSHTPFGPPSAQLTQTQSYMGYEYADGLPTRSHEMGSSSILRGSPSQNPVAHQSTYPDYLHAGVRSLSGSSIKQENLTRNII